MWRGAAGLGGPPPGQGARGSRGAQMGRTQAPEAPEARVGHINYDRKRVCTKPDMGTGSQAPGRARQSRSAARASDSTAALQTLPGAGPPCLPVARASEVWGHGCGTCPGLPGLRARDRALVEGCHCLALGTQGRQRTCRHLPRPVPPRGSHTFAHPCQPWGTDTLSPDRLSSLPQQSSRGHRQCPQAQRDSPRPRSRPGLGTLASPSLSHAGRWAVGPLPTRCLLPGREAKLAPFPSRSSAEHFKVPGVAEAKSPSGPRREADAVTPHSRGKAEPRGGKGNGQGHSPKPRVSPPSASVLPSPGFAPAFAPLSSRAAPPALGLL